MTVLDDNNLAIFFAAERGQQFLSSRLYRASHQERRLKICIESVKHIAHRMSCQNNHSSQTQACCVLQRTVLTVSWCDNQRHIMIYSTALAKYVVNAAHLKTNHHTWQRNGQRFRLAFDSRIFRSAARTVWISLPHHLCQRDIVEDNSLVV